MFLLEGCKWRWEVHNADPQNKSLFAQEALGEPSKLVAEQIARLQLNQTCLALTAANDAGANISKEINTF